MSNVAGRGSTNPGRIRRARLERGDPSIYRDKKFITEMNERLSKWRAGWKRVFGNSGTSFSLQHELGTRGEESFSGRERLEASKSQDVVHS